MSDASAASTTAPPQPLSPPEAPTEAPDSTPDGQPLSKKAQKKLAKAAYIAERKKERRAAEKERKKEKKRVLAEKRAAGELDEDEETVGRDRKRQKTEQGPRTPFGARVVVDLGFDEKMTENVSVWSGPRSSSFGCLCMMMAGGQVPHFATCVHVQREPQSRTSLFVAAVHFVEWENEDAYGQSE